MQFYCFKNGIKVPLIRKIIPVNEELCAPYNQLYNIMRNILLSIIIFIFNQSCLFSQSKPVENLKKYDFYIETRSYEGNWIRKYFLKNWGCSKISRYT